MLTTKDCFSGNKNKTAMNPKEVEIRGFYRKKGEGELISGLLTIDLFDIKSNDGYKFDESEIGHQIMGG